MGLSENLQIELIDTEFGGLSFTCKLLHLNTKILKLISQRIKATNTELFIQMLPNTDSAIFYT